MIARAVRVLACLLLTGCGALRAEQEAPALIAKSSAESRAELARVVSSALGGVPVTLADDALTRESELTIERAPLRDERGLLLNGRELGRPEQFRLLKVGADCVLEHQRTGQRWKLTQASCVAAPG